MTTENSNRIQLTEKETEKAKSTNFFVKIWQDSVMSQLIATGILFLLPFVSAFVIKLLEEKSISEFFKGFLKLEIKLYVLLLIAIFLIIGYWVYLKFFQKGKKYDKLFLTQQIGYYRFGDLNNVLLTTYMELPIPLNHQLGLKELDLLTLFKIFISHFSQGIEYDHPTNEGGFLYYNLGPKLISYGLCENRPSLRNNQSGEINTYAIHTSENGFKFYALLESYDRIENRESYEKENEKRQKIKQNAIGN